MKKSVIIMLSLICVTVMIVTAVLVPGFVGGEDGVIEQVTGNVSTLATGEVPVTSVAPAYDTPLPENYEKWDGTVADGFAKGTGKKSDPFRISTPSEFAFMILACKQYQMSPDGVSYVSAYYELTEDLVFNDDFEVNGYKIDDDVKATLTVFSAASHTTEFRGVLNGAGHKLYNLYIPFESKGAAPSAGVGLFGLMEGGIFDLHIVRGYMTCRGNAGVPGAGSFARELTGTIDGCSSGMTMYTRDTVSGGLAGIMYNKDAKKTAQLNNCTFTGKLYARGETAERAPEGVGGILGRYEGVNDYSKKPTIVNCINYGTVNSSGKRIGGIIGTIFGNHQNKPDTFTIEHCINFGNVECSYVIPAGESSPGKVLIGGILGSAGNMKEGGDASVVTTTYRFNNCANLGVVTAQENGIGGIIGGLQIANGSLNNPLRFDACYSLGTVKNEAPDGSVNSFGGKAVGGFIGDAITPTELVDCIAGGTVKGVSYVGGVIGRQVSDTNWSGSLRSNITIISSHIKADVVGTSSVGEVVGRYSCGATKDSTVFTMKGSFVEGTVKGENIVGSLVGEIIKGKGGSIAKFVMEYAVVDVYVEKTTKIGSAGIMIGGSPSGCIPALEEKEFYIASNVYDSSSGTAVKKEDAKPMHNDINIVFANTFVEDNLTSGTYLNRLELGAAKEGADIVWIASTADKRPIHETADQILAQPLNRSFDGTATKLSHVSWLGFTPNCAWQVWDGEKWVTCYETPTDVGVYRGMIALLTDSVTGAAVVEFEITKMVVDFEKLKWEGDTAPVYSGEEHVVELGGVPEGIKVTYTGSRAVDANEYTAHLVSVEDISGNYDIRNVDKVQDQEWLISATKIDMNTISWSNIDPLTNRPKLTYNGEQQYIYLVENPVADENGNIPEPRNITALLGVQYDGNSGTDAGNNYRAKATLSYKNSNITVIHPRDDFDTPWSIEKRVIRPFNDAQYEGGTALNTVEHIGVSLVYDAEEHALAYKGNLPTCVEVEIGEDVYVNAGVYPYTVTFTLTDNANNVFAVESESRPGTFNETSETVLTCTRYLVIEKATPNIDGINPQTPTYVPYDKSGHITDRDGNPITEPTTYAVGISYAQDHTIEYDAEGNEILTIKVKINGSKELEAELAEYSVMENFSIRYYALVQEPDTGEIKEVPVTNEMGATQDVNLPFGGWCRPYNAGAYKAVITFRAPEDCNFTDVTATSLLQISPAKYELPLNIVMRDEERAVDGDTHILHLQYEETLPDFITPVYYCDNTKTYPVTAGRYRFRVEFVFDEEMRANYMDLNPMEAYLTLVTETLTDYDTKVNLILNKGTYWRLLVKEREDTDAFVTDWKMGYNTYLASLYQIELKNEFTNIYNLTEESTLRLPLSEAVAARGKNNITPVYVTIDEKGNFELIPVEKYTFELTSDGDLPTYVDLKIKTIGYYGIVTTVDRSADGRNKWLIFAGCMIPPAVILGTVAITVKVKRKKKEKEDTDSHLNY